jgi:hypothetical protein
MLQSRMGERRSAVKAGSDAASPLFCFLSSQRVPTKTRLADHQRNKLCSAAQCLESGSGPVRVQQFTGTRIVVERLVGNQEADSSNSFVPTILCPLKSMPCGLDCDIHLVFVDRTDKTCGFALKFEPLSLPKTQWVLSEASSARVSQEVESSLQQAWLGGSPLPRLCPNPRFAPQGGQSHQRSLETKSKRQRSNV